MTGRLRTFANSSKVFAGAGTFALPWAFHQVGLGLGIIGYILMSSLSYVVMRLWFTQGYAHTYTMLPTAPTATDDEADSCDMKASDGRRDSHADTFTQKGNEKTYYGVTEDAYGSAGYWISKIGVLVLIIGVVTTYWILGAQSIHELVGGWATYERMALALLPFYAGLSYLPNLNFLAFTSALGSLSLVTGMVTVVIVGYGGEAEWKPFRYSWFQFDGLPLFMGVVGFLFFVLPALDPIALEMRTKKEYADVLGLVFLVIGIFNLAFAFICEGLVNEDLPTPQNILDAIPKGASRTLVRVALAVEMALTLPIVIQVVFLGIESEILTHPAVVEKIPFVKQRPFLCRNISRTVILCFICTLVIFIQNFGLFTSLVGSLFASLSTLALPAIVLFKLQGFNNIPIWERAILIIGLMMGVFMACFGTYQAISGLIKGDS